MDFCHQFDFYCRYKILCKYDMGLQKDIQIMCFDECDALFTPILNSFC